MWWITVMCTESLNSMFSVPLQCLLRVPSVCVVDSSAVKLQIEMAGRPGPRME